MKKAVKINMEESDIALLDIQAKEKGISRADLVRDRLFASNGARGYTPQDLAALVSAAIAYPISLGVRWSASSTRYLLRLCLGLGRQPALVYKACNGLLLKVQGEERMADLAKFVLRFAVVKITPEAFQLEKTTGGEPIMGKQRCKGMDETAFATLSYYMVSEMPGTHHRQVSLTGRPRPHHELLRTPSLILPRTFVVYKMMWRTRCLLGSMFA